MEILFWASFGFLFYTYLGYPLMMVQWSRLRRKPLVTEEKIYPRVTVVIAVHNEQERIKARLENIFSQSYPQQKLDVVVVSDGSTDETEKVLKEMNLPRLAVIELAANEGKAVALNHGIAAATGEIVVFTDSRQWFAPNAIELLVQPFANPQVGGATGELVLCESRSGGEPKGVGLYWRYEKAIRAAESGVDSTVGATGAIYAIRRRLYKPLPANLILDDVLTPLNITAQGYQLKMVRDAIAYDYLSTSGAEEFHRKVRTLAGNIQLILLAPWVLNPARNRLFFQWFSHKICRLIAPYALLGFFISPWFVGGPTYIAFGMVQLFGYGAALFGLRAVMRGDKVALVGVPASFLMLNWAAVVGLYSVLFGRTDKLWKKN